MILIQKGKREDYIKAWNYMYKQNKNTYNKDPLYIDINPSLNKIPLKTEINNFCTIAYDTEVKTDEFVYGKPVGIFSFVVTNSKTIGKQFVVAPDYSRKGIGKALLLVNMKTLVDNNIFKFYIGCSKCSSGILKSFGYKPYNEDPEHDMYKYNIEIKDDENVNFDNLYKEYVKNNKNIIV